MPPPTTIRASRRRIDSQMWVLPTLPWVTLRSPDHRPAARAPLLRGACSPASLLILSAPEYNPLRRTDARYQALRDDLGIASPMADRPRGTGYGDAACRLVGGTRGHALAVSRLRAAA